MPILTTGINSAAQAAEILAQLAAELVPLGVTHVTRGRLRHQPPLPFAALLGPDLKIEPLGIAGAKMGSWKWTVLIVRQFDDLDARASLMDTWADACMGALMDLLPTATTFAYDGGDEPERIEDERLGQLIAGLHEDVDATAIVFGTKNEITAPC